jgi:hypothetical protein
MSALAASSPSKGDDFQSMLLMSASSRFRGELLDNGVSKPGGLRIVNLLLRGMGTSAFSGDEAAP